MTKLLEGKSGLVTGAASGIGRASAIAFAKEGAKVMVSDVSQEGGEETVRLIIEEGGEAEFFKCDVSDEGQVKALVEATIAAFGKLDWAHNNAGIASPSAPIADMESKDWKKTLSIDLDGSFYCLKYELAAMMKSGGGAIVNTSSTAGLRGVPNLSPYSSSKWGVNGLTKTAAIEYGKYGIRVNSICPGMTETPGVEAWTKGAPEQAAQVKSTIPLGRLGTAEEQANAAIWLCSDKASYITGVNLEIDGGRSAE